VYRVGKLKRIYLGDFEIVSGKAIVSDPCYELGTWCQGTLNKVKKGPWEAYAYILEDRSLGKRVAHLTAFHEKCLPRAPYSRDWKTEYYIGVDSGQAGIFDRSHYQDQNVVKDLPDDPIDKEDPWYSLCCDRTREYGGTIPYGVVSSSGLGDGSYVCPTIYGGDDISPVLSNGVYLNPCSCVCDYRGSVFWRG